MDLKFKKTITKWDEAIPLGNGHLGALVWGKASALRFSLDRADIWDLTPSPRIYEEDFNYQTIIQFVKEGNEEEIRKKFSSIYRGMTPTKLPAGKLILHLSSQGNVESSLNLETAKADICTEGIRLRSFILATQKFGLVEVDLPLTEFSYCVETPGFRVGKGSTYKIGEHVRIDSASLENLYYPAPVKETGKESCYFVQPVSDSFSYGVFAAAKQEGTKSLIVFGVATSDDGENWQEEMKSMLREALERGYEDLFAEHCGWWKTYWSKSSISIPDQFMEHHWYLTNYLLASCSRKGGYPMQLQGLWTADHGNLPPWKGDYHHDLNTQLSYFNYLKANHLEEGECFLDFLWEMVGKGEEFARSFYGTDGMCLPSIMGLDGTPLGGWAMYSFSPTNQIWLCQIFERHYRYTGNRTFLQERAYPYMKKTASCIIGLLEEKDGKYYLPVSSSPEIHDDTIQAFLTPNSNYDLALMRYLFICLVDLAKELGNGEDGKWQDILGKLPELAVNEEGIMLLSPDEELTESHRHFSHLMGIHPLRLVDYHSEEGKQMIDANIHRQEILGSGYWVGYSLTLMAEMYAISGNGNGAAWHLRTFWDSFCSPNGFHLNGDYKHHGISQFHYRPFTLEGNMCAADALQEMLLQSEKGMLDLFPAIPDEWQEEKVSFRHFRAEGGILVSAVLEKGQVTELTFENNEEKEIRIWDSVYLEKMAEKYKWHKEDGYYILKKEGYRLK